MEERKDPSAQSGLGMRLHKKVLNELQRLNIVARPAVSIAFQQKQKRWVIAGEEGGGSVDKIGHYVGFLGVAPDGLAVSIPIQSLIPNAIQRRVISSELVRIEAFRYEQSCQYNVTHHYLVSPGEGRRPELHGRELFRAYNGILTSDSKQPVFFDRAGEPVDLPADLIPAIQAVTRGILSLRNKRAHLISVPAIILPPIEALNKQEPVASLEVSPAATAIAIVETATPKKARARTRTVSQPEEEEIRA